MKVVSFWERVTVMLGFCDSTTCLKAPSTTARTFLGLRTTTVILEWAGKTMERRTLKEQMGVKTKASTEGSRTGPPAESE